MYLDTKICLDTSIWRQVLVVGGSRLFFPLFTSMKFPLKDINSCVGKIFKWSTHTFVTYFKPWRQYIYLWIAAFPFRFRKHEEEIHCYVLPPFLNIKDVLEADVSRHLLMCIDVLIYLLHKAKTSYILKRRKYMQREAIYLSMFFFTSTLYSVSIIQYDIRFQVPCMFDIK
jgi:hypothetical protein